MNTEERNKVAEGIFAAAKELLFKECNEQNGIGFVLSVFQDEKPQISMDICHACAPAHVTMMVLDLLKNTNFETAIYRAIKMKSEEDEAQQHQPGHA